MNARQPLTLPITSPIIPPRILAAEAARRLEVAPATFWKMVKRGESGRLRARRPALRERGEL